MGVDKGGDEMFRKCGDPKTDQAYHLVCFCFLFFFFLSFFSEFLPCHVLPSFLQADIILPIAQLIEYFHHTPALLMELRLV